jgi:HEAT repeat protein
MFASSALAMIGTEETRAALLEGLESERSSLTRAAIAQSLGQYGRLEDAAVIVGVLQELREPYLQGLTATAMGFHGSSEGLRRLGELAAARDTNPVTRAASLDGIGMLLGRIPALELTELSRYSNFTLFTPWTDGMLQVTL